jgi:PIN domain nuclease of toxin-antitoxin system
MIVLATQVRLWRVNSVPGTVPDMRKDPVDRLIVAAPMLHRSRIATARLTLRRDPGS